MSSDPWESPPEFPPLFTDDDEFSLCEGDTDPVNYIYYALGEMIANLHAQGVVYGDLHTGNVLFDAYKSWISLVDWDSASFHTPL